MKIKFYFCVIGESPYSKSMKMFPELSAVVRISTAFVTARNLEMI